VAGLALAGCDAPRAPDPDRPPAPSFATLVPPAAGELMTTSSPSLADLDGDGVLDVVFGTGVDRVRRAASRMLFTEQPAISGHVVAVSGATNQVLWQTPNPRDAFTTPRFAQLNGDQVPDVVMGGREGVLTAFDGTNGAVLWRVQGAQLARTPWPYCFFTPAVVADANGDGVADLVASYGGNDMRLPEDPRDPGFLAVISGADGRVLKVQMLPDSSETYASPIVYRRRDGAEWVLIGTGGETHGGAEYRAPVASLLDGTFPARVERLLQLGAKGVIAPPTLVELTGDGELDVVISTFDGRLAAVDGATGKALWQREDRNEEAYHQPAVVRLATDGRLGLFVSRGLGAFPRYLGSVHRLHDAADGRVLHEYRDPHYPAGAPLAVDLTGDGVDEPIFFSTRFPSTQGGKIHVLHLPSKKLVVHDVEGNYWSTPVVADLRTRGALELIGLSWRAAAGTSARPDLKWQLLRLDLSAKAPAFRGWAAYMGTQTDGHYRPAAAGSE
jgi:outer membrane protein assembly factor BamB